MTPNYTTHWKTGHGELRENYEVSTPILGHMCSARYIHLNPTGRLYLRAGYVWDFGSGPAIDTPDMVAASLVHDAFYELMVRGALPWSERKAVDKFFAQQLKDYGMPWWRRAWVYAGVRYGYPILKTLGKVRNA